MLSVNLTNIRYFYNNIVDTTSTILDRAVSKLLFLKYTDPRSFINLLAFNFSFLILEISVKINSSNNNKNNKNAMIML